MIITTAALFGFIDHRQLGHAVRLAFVELVLRRVG
jgi:hypothetical protein